MKHSDIKPPKGTTHVRLTTADGKASTVEVKSMATLDGVAGKLTFFRMVKNKLVEIHPEGASIVATFKEQKEGKTALVRMAGTGDKEKTKALKALAQKFNGGTWKFEHAADVKLDGAPDIDLTIKAGDKAKPGQTVKDANRAPLKDRKATGDGEKKDTERKPNKGERIEALLKDSGWKLSTILDHVMKEFPEGNRTRTLRRIRKVAVALKKGQHKLSYIDEPEFKAGE